MNYQSFLRKSIFFAVLVISGCDNNDNIPMKEENNGNENLSVGQFESIPDVQGKSFLLANTSEMRGNVVIWYSRNGSAFCERVTNIEANQTLSLQVPCRALGSESGSGSLNYSWAKNVPERLAVSKRIE